MSLLPSRHTRIWCAIDLVIVAAVFLGAGIVFNGLRFEPRHATAHSKVVAVKAVMVTPPLPVVGPTAPAAVAQPRIRRVFSIEHFGRYAVSLASPQGAALQLIDRMAGPGDEDGVAGQRDGRIDGFLGPGEHQAVMTPLPGAAPLPELSVRSFEELNGATPPQLTELALVQDDLGDLQQRSYWLDIRARQTVFIEAAGRHLQDLRLWKDGAWLVDAVPGKAQSEPKPGQPLAVRQLVANLEPGLYRLTAYGGVGQTWTQGGDESPFVLRWGIPVLPETSLRRMTAGPFGFDRWLVPGPATYFRLELPQGDTGVLTVGGFFNGHIAGEERSAIDKNTRSASTELSRQPLLNERHVVTIERAAGQPYVLQNYVARRSYTFNGTNDAEYLLGTLRPGHDEDDVDLTAVLTQITGNTAKVIAKQTLVLGPTTPWRRRFNLLGTTSLFVEVTAPGRYTVEAKGAEADIAWAPLADTGKMRTQPSKSGGGVWDLDAGLYTLEISPQEDGLGILSLSLHGEASPEAAEPSPPLLGASFAPVRLEHGSRYHLTTNQAPGPGFGAVLRSLPADLTEDLPLVLAPGEHRSLPVTLPATGTVQALSDDNAALTVTLDAGAHSVEVVNPTASPVLAALHFQPAAAARPPALPAMAAKDLKALPDFPVLAAGAPHFLDLTARQTATFAVKVETPALYRVETTGLLQTSGTMRTQVLPSLARASANGVGRNMLLQYYLGEGLYQLTVATEGETAGHLGVSLTAAPIRDGGVLDLGIAARTSLGPGEGVAYGVDVAEPGRYRLQALSLAGATAIRLEDSEGWPLTTPGQSGDLTLDLQPGRYRLVVQPQALPGRMLTLVEPLRTPPVPAGHGPHPLALDGEVANRWLEPVAGAERSPDVWAFDLPAEADLTIALSDLMGGEIWRDGEEGQAVAALSSREAWHGRLTAGHYHLDVKSLRPNNRLDYTITSRVVPLIAGQRRTVTAPVTIPLALGGDQLVEISSFGGAEVWATLLDGEGKVVARSDERPDDWNFTIASRLPPGQYRLKVEPMGAAQATTEIRVAQLAEQLDAPLAAPGERQIADEILHVIPLDLQPADGPLLVAAARSADTVGLALEQRSPGGDWQSVGTASGRNARLAVARDLAAKAEYRLRVWSMDHSRQPIALALRVAEPSMASEADLAAGLTLTAVPGLEPPLGVAAVKLERPGLFRLEGQGPGLAWSTASGHQLAHGPELVVAGGTALWFLGDSASGPVRAKRVVPDAQAPLALTLPAGETAGLPLAENGHGPRLWVAESRVGQPGLSLDQADARSSGFGAGVAAALLPDGGEAANRTMRLWRADGVDELPVTLRQFAFAKPLRADLDFGESDQALDGGAALTLALPKGGKRLRLALPPRTAAALLKDGAVDRLLWSGGQPMAASLDSSADHLMLLNAGSETGRLSLLMTPASEGGLSLAQGVMLRQALPTAGTLLVDVALSEAGRGKGLALHVSGPVEEALLLQQDGKLRSGGTGLVIDQPGLLVLRHGPGAIAAWLDNGDEGHWLAAAKTASAQALPATLALSGAETAWRFAAAKPGLLHLSSAVPVMTGVLRPNGAPELTVWPQGANLHLFLAAGQDAVAGLRPLQEGELSGAAWLSRSEVVAIDEGLGPKVRLAPGDARLFGFTLKAAGPIGVGVRGEADSARVRLLDGDGKTLAEGAVAMADLPAGSYFLLVENRSDANATEIQPALVGAAKPDRGPPEEIKRQYWDLVSQEEGK